MSDKIHDELLIRGAIVSDKTKFAITRYGMILLSSDLEQEILDRYGKLTYEQRRAIIDMQNGHKTEFVLKLLNWWQEIRKTEEKEGSLK